MSLSRKYESFLPPSMVPIHSCKTQTEKQGTSTFPADFPVSRRSEGVNLISCRCPLWHLHTLRNQLLMDRSLFLPCSLLTSASDAAFNLGVVRMWPGAAETQWIVVLRNKAANSWRWPGRQTGNLLGRGTDGPFYTDAALLQIVLFQIARLGATQASVEQNFEVDMMDLTSVCSPQWR